MGKLVCIVLIKGSIVDVSFPDCKKKREAIEIAQQLVDDSGGIESKAYAELWHNIDGDGELLWRSPRKHVDDAKKEIKKTIEQVETEISLEAWAEREEARWESSDTGC